MTQYLVAQITIHDREAYGRYQTAFMPVLRQYGGRLLAADEGAQVLEGDWPFDKLILMAFDDAAAVQTWFESPEYQAISVDRRLGSKAVAVSITGF